MAGDLIWRPPSTQSGEKGGPNTEAASLFVYASGEERDASFSRACLELVPIVCSAEISFPPDAELKYQAGPA